MNSDQFKSEFIRNQTLRGRFWNWYYGFCKTCRGQEVSTLSGTLCPTCGGTGKRPFAKTHTFLDWW